MPRPRKPHTRLEIRMSTELNQWLKNYSLISATADPDTGPTHPIEGQYIKEWLILGPFEGADLARDLLAEVGGEENVNPKEGDTVITPTGKTLT